MSVLTAATPERGMHLAVQERVMRGQELSKRTLGQAGADSAGERSTTPGASRDMHRVTSLPDTSRVELAAVGGEPQHLAVLVDAHQDLRRELVQLGVVAAPTALRDEQAGLLPTIEECRDRNPVLTRWGPRATAASDAVRLQQVPRAPAIAAAATASLPPALPRELTPAEVGALWSAAVRDRPQLPVSGLIVSAPSCEQGKEQGDNHKASTKR